MREVDDYVENYKQALLERHTWRLWHHQPGRLRFSVHNLTDTNFTDVKVTVHVAGDVSSWPDEAYVDPDEPGPPRRPDQLGTAKPFSFGFPSSMVDSILMPRPPTLPSIISAGPGYTVEDSGSVTVSFDSTTSCLPT